MSKSNWIIPFTIVDSLNRMFYGMYPTLLGPSLPFLANAVNVDIETINWLQPFGKSKSSQLKRHNSKVHLICS